MRLFRSGAMEPQRKRKHMHVAFSCEIHGLQPSFWRFAWFSRNKRRISNKSQRLLHGCSYAILINNCVHVQVRVGNVLKPEQNEVCSTFEGSTTRCVISSDTCSAMAYLEAKLLVHRDLAARNVHIHADGTAKVSLVQVIIGCDCHAIRMPVHYTKA